MHSASPLSRSMSSRTVLRSVLFSCGGFGARVFRGVCPPSSRPPILGNVEPSGLVLPIFPLPNVVLFPRVQCPLHLFEPRYRQMAERVLQGDPRDRCIGMVTVPPEHTAAMAGDPPVYPVGCAGQITQAQRLPDSRYNIVLLGTHRFRIVAERARPSDQLYRVAEVTPLGDPYPEAERERVVALRARVMELIARLALQSAPEAVDAFSPAVFAGFDDGACVNTLSNALGLPPEEKQGLLEADGVPQRFDRLEGLLSFRLAQMRVGAPPSGQSH